MPSGNHKGTTIQEKVKVIRRYTLYKIKRLTERIEKLEYLKNEMKYLKKTFSNIIKRKIR